MRKRSEIRITETIYTEEQIAARVAELAREIESYYRQELGVDFDSGKPLLMVGILKGAFVFLADLARQMNIPVEFDFVGCSSYGSGTKSSGTVRITKDIGTELRGRHVLLVEDIMDTGLTLGYLVSNLKAREPASIEICALLDKQIEGKTDLPVKFVGFTIPDVFVVGFGLDCDQHYRHLKYIAGIEKTNSCS